MLVDHSNASALDTPRITKGALSKDLGAEGGMHEPFRTSSTIVENVGRVSKVRCRHDDTSEVHCCLEMYLHKLHGHALVLSGVASALYPLDRGERDRGPLRHLHGRLSPPTRNGERLSEQPSKT